MAVPDRPLDDAYRIEALDDGSAITADDVLRFWEREGAVTGREAQRRLSEVLLVATAADGSIAGVASTYLEHSARLAMDMWHFRVYVAPDHRQSNLAAQLAVRGRDVLEHRYVSGQDGRAPGIVYEVESAVLKELTLATWRQTQFAFLGEDERGAHLRVWYFPGALVPPPPVDGPPSPA